MKKVTLKVPEFGFVVATRAALGFGAGLLASSRIPQERRRSIGIALVVFGAAATVPAVISIRRNLSS